MKLKSDNFEGRQSFSIEDFRRRASARLQLEPPDPAVRQGFMHGDHGSAQLQPNSPALAKVYPAAVLVPIVAGEEPTVLLTERATTLRKHSGQIAFPGGRIDSEGESPGAAAYREAQEEIGLDPAAIETLGYLDFYFTGSGYRITPVVSVVSPPFSLEPNPQEVASVFEVPLSFLMQAANHQRVVRKSDGRGFYAMPYGSRYIWGATAGIIRLLYEKLYA